MSLKTFCDYEGCNKEINNRPRIIRTINHEGSNWKEYCEEHLPIVWKRIMNSDKRNGDEKI